MTFKSNKGAGKRKSLLTGASVFAAAAAAMSGSPAVAQDVEEEEAIVVTGTRLVRQDFEAISPVTTVGAEQLELTATLTTDSLLNELPQIVPGNTRTSNNAGGFSYATVDLRGLGPNRTLVLINGERVPASSTLGAVDLNTVPASLISRVEVVTGGASAVYGSDALAGVINFVLKDDYEGAELNVTYGSELETGNAAEFEINGLVGGNFANGRGNMTAYASYYDRQGVLQSEYDYSRVSAALCYDGGVEPSYFVCDNVQEAIGNGWLVSPFVQGGSATPPWGTINNNAAGRGPDGFWGTADDTGNPFGGAATAGLPGPDGILGTADDIPVFGGPNTLNVILPGQFGAGNTDQNCDGVGGAAVLANQGLSFNDAGQLTPINGSGFCGIPDRASGSSRYNYAPDNFLLIPAERVALTTSGHYDITDNLRLNVLINYTNSRSEVQLAATPATSLTVTLTPGMEAYINANHPDLGAALDSRPNPDAPFVINYRTNQVGTRNAFYESNNFFFIVGLEGALGENWDWNLSASHGQVMFNTRAINSVNRTAINQGLAACEDAAGNPLGAAALPGCTVVDMFGPNNLSQAAIDFIRVDTYNDTLIEESRVSGFVRGDLFEMPAGPVATVFGFEYRDTFSGSYNDNESRTGNIAGFNAVQDQEGQIDVYELYTEASVPLVSEAPFAHYLGLEAGYRRSNYSSVGNVDSFKIGGEWAPVEWLRFRAMFNEATRAPSVFEVFQAGDQGFVSFVDPCNNGPNNAACIAAPGAAAVPAALYPGFAQNNGQVQTFAFGNPNLAAETAETWTYGLVFTPDWFPLGDLRASVDYFDIEITDVVTRLSGPFFLTDCYVNLVASSCARITRDPATGQVISVNTTLSNQGVLATSGYDLQLEWSLPLGPGQLTINELYSILDSWSFNGVELSGTTSAAIGSAFPDYKSVLSVSYNVGDWTLFGRWSYTPEMDSSFLEGTFGFDIGPTPEASYVDVSARWNVTDNFSVTANVDNIFDDYPPQTPDGLFSQGNTDPQVYRVLGRTFAISGR